MKDKNLARRGFFLIHPNHMQLTIAKQLETESFARVFKQVMAA